MSTNIFECFTRDPDTTQKRMFGNIPFSFDGRKAEYLGQNEIIIWGKAA